MSRRSYAKLRMTQSPKGNRPKMLAARPSTMLNAPCKVRSMAAGCRCTATRENAQAREAHRRLDIDDHRTLGVPAGGRTADAAEDVLVGRLEIQQPETSTRVQTVDEVLHILRRIASPGQARHGVFELAPIDHDRGRQRELVGLAGVIEMKMGVQDISHVAEPDPMGPELSLERLPGRLEAAQPDPLQDFGMPEPGVDDDDVLGTDEQEALDRKPNPNARSPRRDGTAAVDLERAEVQNLDVPGQASAPPAASTYT